MKLGQAWAWIKARPARMVVLVLVAALVIVALIPTVITWAPHWLASTEGLNASQRADEVGRVRTALLAAIAGSIAVVGAIYTGRTFALNRQGQITERLTRAVDQLGNTSLDVRVGGIYALERLANESPNDHAPIVEILTAYVRERARRERVQQTRTDGPSAQAEQPPVAPTPNDQGQDEAQAVAGLRTDLQAVLTVLGRREVDDADPRLDLGQAFLMGAKLVEAKLQGADLRGANLQGANLYKANLEGAFLNRANLQKADLSLANLHGAVLIKADLEEATLNGANLQEADLAQANLHGAFLLSADLRRAGLFLADLHDAFVSPANLEGATLNRANLKGTDLSGSNLNGADLSGANLSGANLQEANLQEAHLSEAGLQGSGADLQEANLSGVNLQGAYMWEVNLSKAALWGATLSQANLEGANLSGASLNGANLSGANLSGANLSGANLSGANLSGANLQRTYYDRETTWPNDFDPGAGGAVLQTSGHDRLPPLES